MVKVRRKIGVNYHSKESDMNKLFVMIFSVFVFTVSTESVKADCFPCFDTTTERISKKKTHKQKQTRKPVSAESFGSGTRGIASYYWQPQAVACGGRFNPNAMTAAHRTFPCGSRVRVTASNGRSVVVTINDRGPFVKGRIIDLSLAAAKQIGMTKSGLTTVTVERF